ncbi:MAG: hypothetical protein KM310_10930 [Clostridiales bacterium]|nr:hypothetical protein [Clostridiales bacterium]
MKILLRPYYHLGVKTMNRGLCRTVLVLFTCLVMFVSLTMLATAQAKGISSVGTWRIPKGLYIFHVSSEGILGWLPDLQNPTLGCAGPSSIIYRSSTAGEKFEPVTLFSQVNVVFNGPASHQNILDTTGLLSFIWAKKKGEENFSLYFSNDGGRTWNKVPGTESETPCPPFVAIPDLVNSQKAYIIPSTPTVPFLGEQPLSLNSFLETKNGGVSWEKKSLPGQTPPAVEGLLFHPNDPKKIWVWRGSMGDWMGVRYSEDGGLTWSTVPIPAEGRISGVTFNPYTGEVVVTGRGVISSWQSGKGKDLRGECGLPQDARADFVAGPPLFNPQAKNVLFPVFFWGNGGVTGVVYAYKEGKVKKITTFSVEQGDPVYAFLSEGKLYLSLMNAKGPGQVLEYPLPAISAPLWWPILSGVLVLGILVYFLLRWRVSALTKQRKN